MATPSPKIQALVVQYEEHRAKGKKHDKALAAMMVRANTLEEQQTDGAFMTMFFLPKELAAAPTVNPSMLRPVCLGELQTCTCTYVSGLLLVPEEAFPRCFECVKPVRDVRKKVCVREHKWQWLVWRVHEAGLSSTRTRMVNFAPFRQLMGSD